jgi:hypothetical protein
VANIPNDEATPVAQVERLPKWIVRGLILLGVILTPWALWLGFTLPRRTAAYHWDAAWAGFDLLLAVALALTGILAWKRSHWALTASGAAAGMLVCDAWFDVMTSSSRGRPLAVGEALFVELPLALVCVWLARRAGRSLERDRHVADVAKRLQVTRNIRVSRDGPLP